MYERIIDKLNDQFNVKYTSSSQIPESQPDLNNEKSELSVHTKGIEIIGGLTCALWIYCNGKCITSYNLTDIVTFLNLSVHWQQLNIYVLQLLCVS